MVDAAAYTVHSVDHHTPNTPEIYGHLHRLKSDYRFRHEIRREMLGTLTSVFSSKRQRTG